MAQAIINVGFVLLVYVLIGWNWNHIKFAVLNRWTKGEYVLTCLEKISNAVPYCTTIDCDDTISYTEFKDKYLGLITNMLESVYPAKFLEQAKKDFDFVDLIYKDVIVHMCFSKEPNMKRNIYY